MKKLFFIFNILIITTYLFAQENSDSSVPLDDVTIESIDDLFNDTSSEVNTSTEENSDRSEQPETLSVLDDLKEETGGSLTVKYAFAAGFSPGWSESPWYWENEDETFTKVVGADLTSDFIFDFQLTPRLRAYQSFSIDFPSYEFEIDSFWAEYNLSNMAFFKLGQYAESWGLSGNYNYTNLLSRLPEDGSGGDPYTFRMNLPLGLGGLQLLTMVRSGWGIDGDIENLEAGDLGYGIKYNFAYPSVDVNVGFFYQELMPLRTIVTAKTTLFDSTELFLQGLVSVPNQTDMEDAVFSGSVGLVDDFLKDKLTVNLEYFYNGEVYTVVEETDSGWTEDETSPFIKGHNTAFNLYYNTSLRNINLFSRFLYNFSSNTGKWAPGVRFKPYNDLSVYLSVPIVVGDRDGTYYSSNYDEKNRPFSVTLAITLSGSQKFAQYKKFN
ncbi:hypothetical protein EXM22_02905 [Oceanispirochaeta crateris]|uniref:Uncharacterized protein n=1 Tax=Oceanispirochaeta crateris TaxID=2518645 RepID=A0A5C1QFQ5_9SPIO|nr:hypothetical protein [Oceanispirochaeta crateris]QEN06983.1 hypothetical protein EXM22_02905 [Oceanispirochaeta crateris]